MWPTCYETCTLYTPREDLKCQRFVDGMVRVYFDGGVMPFLLKISFKRWAKLSAPASLEITNNESACKAEAKDLRQARLMRLLPGSAKRKIKRIRRRYVTKRDRVVNRPLNGAGPSHFAIECHNPNTNLVDLTVSMAPSTETANILFEQRAIAKPGYNRIMIEVADIGRRVDLSKPFGIAITPNLSGELLTLYFGCIDFVTLVEGAIDEAPAAPKVETVNGSKKVKCVVWDLDNTLWNGILIEEGVEGITLKPGIREIISELDNRGILHSVASKNDPEVAMSALEHFGLAEYFLYPQISWGPKSIGIQRIAKSLNIGYDTFLFVEDAEFERAEVSETLPSIRVLDAAEFLRLPVLPECQVPVTAESRKRRLFFTEAVNRQAVSEQFEGNYEGFLRSCNLRINVHPLSPSNLKRVYELTQRTNQMNFSGNRYTIGFLEEIMSSTVYGTLVIDCEDRFGTYGIIGFCIIQNGEPRMTDLMFSCRIQHKRVDHAVLRFAIDKYRRKGYKKFYADYRRTERNSAAGKVFDDFGFVEIGEKNGVNDLLFPAESSLEDDGIVEFVDIENSE